MPNWRPIPENQANLEKLIREVTALTTRMDANDRAVALLQAFADRQPTIAEVVAKFEERFVGIEERFRERDKRFDLRSADDKASINAALVAQKEAIAKSEAAFTKQIDSLEHLLNVTGDTLTANINDNRSRVTAIESRSQAYSSGFGFIATGIGIVGAIVGAIVAIFFKSSGTQ